MSDSKPASPTHPWLQLAQPFASLLAVTLGLVFLQFFFGLNLNKLRA